MSISDKFEESMSPVEFGKDSKTGIVEDRERYNVAADIMSTATMADEIKDMLSMEMIGKFNEKYPGVQIQTIEGLVEQLKLQPAIAEDWQKIHDTALEKYFDPAQENNQPEYDR